MAHEIVYGLNSVLALLRAGRRPVSRLWLSETRQTDARVVQLQQLAAAQGVAIRREASQKLTQLAAGGQHQGVVAEATGLPRLELDGLVDRLQDLTAQGQQALLVVLDGVEDPRNLGAILRTAAAVGATALVAPRRRQAPLSPVACKVAEGGAEHVSLVSVVNVVAAMTRLKAAGVWFFGFAAEAETAWYEADFSGPVGLVMGSEERGLRRLVREQCDFLLSLPVSGSMPSVNVSAATAVGLYEVVRQRTRLES